jgi:hypothetical protein
MNRPDWLQKYVDRGFKLVFYPTKTKGPQGADAKGWQSRDYPPDSYIEGQNVGVMLGHEVSEGKFLVDIDFDWSDGVPMVKRFFPRTEFGFGRESRKLSHVFYTTQVPLDSFAFKDLDDHTLVEIRGTKKDGTLGFQSMVPPSIHPSGEPVVLRADGDVAHVEASELHRRATLYAIACLLLQQIGQRNLLHDVRLSLAGFLLKCNLTEDEAVDIGEAIAEATRNSVEDVRVTVRSTLARIRRKEKVQGATALVKSLGDTGQKTLGRIREWLGESDFLVDKEGKILKDHQYNIALSLEKMGISLSWDEFRQQPLMELSEDSPFVARYRYSAKRLRLFDDSIATSSWLYGDRTFNFKPSKEFYYDVTMDLAHENPVHPVREYLDSLVWDGTPRLDRWLIESAGAADTDYVRAVSSIVLMAAVKRVRHPGCKFDEILILESQQGLQKSTALSLLCPDETWFSDDLPLDVDAKQIIERTVGKWIVEVAELQGMHPSKMESLKATLSRRVDGPVRRAYGRLSDEVPRQFILIGTTNGHNYLTDFTGNRRFWPVRIVKFILEWIRANRDQVWAEAAHREKEGASIRLPESLYEHAAIQQERRRSEDPWESRIAVAFSDEFQRLTPDSIWECLGVPTERRDMRGQARVNQIMQTLGYRRMTVLNDDGKRVKGWARGMGKRDKFVFDNEHDGDE